MPLVLKKQKFTVAHVNVRQEQHGEDPVLACDVRVTGDLSNKILDDLAPGLRLALYRKEGEASGETASLVDDHTPVLRHPQLGPLKWKLGLVGAAFQVHWGSKAAEALAFSGDVKEAALEALEGGTVQVTFQAAVLPEPSELAKLGELLGREVKVSLAPQPMLEPAEAPRG